MSNAIELPKIWSRGIRFKAYELDKGLSRQKIIESLKKNKVDMDEEQDGWLVKYPFFESEDNKIVSYLYVKFERDGAASKVKGEEIKVPKYTSCNIHYESKVITVSTSSASKLSGLVENEMFEQIRELTRITPSTYSGDFLFWLTYINDQKNKKISEDIIIKDIRAISSKLEKLNLSDAVSAHSDVVSYIEARLILALYGFQDGANISIKASGETYKLELSSDGRIYAKSGSDLGDEEKAIHALQIHNILKRCHDIYTKTTESQDWNKTKNDYQENLLTGCITDLSDRLKEYKSETEK